MTPTVWIKAIRIRTLPLALGSLSVGIAITPSPLIDWPMAALTLLTMLLLQILSNVANDYGDGISGVDGNDRQGPKRVLQSGMVSPRQLKGAIATLISLSAASGLSLLTMALPSWQEVATFILIGFLAIVAAITYTVGKRPYGYAGLGDLSVFIFFGLVAVLGTSYLQSNLLQWYQFLPASAAGFLAAAVLNINNIRDIETDTRAGKYTIASQLGRANAITYHWLLIILAMLGFHGYFFLHSGKIIGTLSLAIPAFALHGYHLRQITDKTGYNPLLKTMVLLAFSTEVLFLLDTQWPS